MSAMFSKRVWRHRHHRRPDRHVAATVKFSAELAEIDLGYKSFFIRALDEAQPQHDHVDFAVFGLAALSCASNIEISVKQPVTRSLVDQMEALRNALHLWLMPNLAPLRLNFENVTEGSQATHQGPGILCLSGGVDSTAAAVIAHEQGGYRDALLIAGADYPSAASQGFAELSDRMRLHSERLELGLRRVETNIRHTTRLRWEMQHTLLLAMSLHYLSPGLGKGAFALDNTMVQDLIRAPWGNTHAGAGLLGTDQFPISGLAGGWDRVEKIKAIAEYDPRLFHTMSVCYEDSSQGGNCGTCPKCVMTRLNYIAADVPEELGFPTSVPLLQLVKGLKIPRRLMLVRGSYIRFSECINWLPEGELRDALLTFETKLQNRIVRSTSEF